MYILATAAVPGWVKIGKTSRDPAKRARALSTGIPGSLEVVASVLVDDARTLERRMHNRLQAVRHPGGDEWFQLEPEQAVEELRDELDRASIEEHGRTLTRRRFFRWAGWFVVLVYAGAFVLAG